MTPPPPPTMTMMITTKTRTGASRGRAEDADDDDHDDDDDDDYNDDDDDESPLIWGHLKCRGSLILVSIFSLGLKWSRQPTAFEFDKMFCQTKMQ